MSFREWCQADVLRVAEIECGAAVVPWPVNQFQSCIEGKQHRGFILEQRQQIVGFAIFALVLDEASLLNIAIDPASQGRGWGRRLLEHCLQTVTTLGARECFLEVRVSNTKAQRLYSSMGFEVIGGRKDYYPAKQGREDALVMSKALAVIAASDELH